MKLIWTRELDAQNPWEPDFHGVFFYQESGFPFITKMNIWSGACTDKWMSPKYYLKGNRELIFISQAGGEISSY